MIETDSTDIQRSRNIYKVTLIGSIVNVFLLVFKFVAGILSGSAAMIADAVHSLSDFATDVIVIAFVRISSKPEDASHHYGHGKYETLATAIVGIMLLCVGGGIFWSGATQIMAVVHGESLSQPGWIALLAAVVSVLMKEMLYHYTSAVGKRTNSQVVVANAWHHRSDALSSVATGVGIAGAILLGGKWRVLDPIAAVLVSVFIVRVAIKLLVPCVEELLEKSLPEEIEKEIEGIILSFPSVSSPHHLRTRRIGNTFAIEVHVRMDGSITLLQAHSTATEIERKLRERYGVDTHIGIHVEPVK